MFVCVYIILYVFICIYFNVGHIICKSCVTVYNVRCVCPRVHVGLPNSRTCRLVLAASILSIGTDWRPAAVAVHNSIRDYT